MKAILFAAGLGTRLQPLTNDRPKAMVELNGKPLIYHAIKKLETVGVKKIVVNVHHFADVIIDYLNNTTFEAEIIISDERNELLDTGGGMLYAKEHLEGDEPFFAMNVDIISSVNLQSLINNHAKTGALATLVVRNRETKRYLIFDDKMKLIGWKNLGTGEYIELSTEPENAYAFSGIQLISPEIFKLTNFDGAFSIISLYLELAQSQTIKGFIDSSKFWLDLGKPGQIEIAEKFLAENSI